MKAALIHEMRHLPGAQREAQVPTHTHRMIGRQKKGWDGRLGIALPYRSPIPAFRNTTQFAIRWLQRMRTTVDRV